MRNKLKCIILGVMLSVSLMGCGQDPQISKFKNDVEDFCDDISSIDSKMNAIDTSSASAKSDLLEYLDEIDMKFSHFAELDFPKDFDYLEPLADEASKLMTEAVKYYHEAFTSSGYNEANAEYAQEIYSRAYKRIQIIISLLHGEEPEGVNVSTVTSEEE